MPISLRIVGILYNRSDIPDDTTKTVEAVLNYARDNPGAPNLPSNNFKYISSVPASGDVKQASITAFFSNYVQNVQSPTSQLFYPPGEYFLSESLVDNPSYAVWQFYVADANGKTILPNPRIISYTQVEVPKGGSVIWRLVKILSAPNRVPTVYRKAFGLKDPIQAAASTGSPPSYLAANLQGRGDTAPTT